jgi:hypothetical protein
MANCSWCGEDLSGPARQIWFDDDGNKYCTKHCFMNSTPPLADEETEEDDEGEDYEY